MKRLLAPLQRKLAMMVGRAVVHVINDTPGWQTLQAELLNGEVRDDIEYAQDYGFTSHPHPGAEAVAVSVAGSRDHLIVVKVGDRRYRLKGLAEGEVAIYTDEGDQIVLKRGREIHMTAGTKVVIDAPMVDVLHNLHVGGSVTVDESVTATGDVIGQGTSLHTHVHSGVQFGTSNTGAPV